MVTCKICRASKIIKQKRQETKYKSEEQTLDDLTQVCQLVNENQVPPLLCKALKGLFN